MSENLFSLTLKSYLKNFFYQHTSNQRFHQHKIRLIFKLKGYFQVEGWDLKGFN